MKKIYIMKKHNENLLAFEDLEDARKNYKSFRADTIQECVINRKGGKVDKERRPYDEITR